MSQKNVLMPITHHKVERFYVRCSCGLIAASLTGVLPNMTLQEFTLWLETFLCEHEAVSAAEPSYVPPPADPELWHWVEKRGPAPFAVPPDPKREKT